MCSWNKQLPNVIGIGPQWATTNVRQKATVVCEVRGSQSTKRLMYEPRDLEHNALTDWQPLMLTTTTAQHVRECHRRNTLSYHFSRSSAWRSNAYDAQQRAPQRRAAYL